jgi:hypothetical protein
MIVAEVIVADMATPRRALAAATTTAPMRHSG